MHVNRIGYASSNFKISIIYNIKYLLEGCSKVASNLYPTDFLRTKSDNLEDSCLLRTNLERQKTRVSCGQT